MNAPITSCEEAIRLIADYIDHELDENESTQLREHMERCKSCYSRVEFEQKLKAQLATLRSAAISEELSRRVRGVLHHYGQE